MKTIALLLALPLLGLHAEEPDVGTKIAEHQEGSRKLSENQDELAADVQQLIIEQTNPKVIELLESVEEAMDEASGLLLDRDTGGTTIAAETDVIERIFEAAKEKQKQSGGQQGEASGAMLEMMQEMMGKGKPADKPGDQPGQKPGDKGGEGQTGDSDSANSKDGGTSGTKFEERRVPKASGKAGQGLPREFQDALDAYNRAAEKLAK
ncbi:hypothetical protein OKA05_22280 [Luteolibacter arcticus]|uniref:Uncharacterized protein n=1 Tax=Luteolibacter arcticus TaxID=1581411 RepID=A0ABT3GP61_9BACT|nr:hypothetical protein [Luteolibacter arcticus]MCW1925304.1 hypothetical protein [Luteolibacter arcticus]